MNEVQQSYLKPDQFLYGTEFIFPKGSENILTEVKDIYSPESMLALDDRTDEAVAAGLMSMMKKEWDKKAIIKTVERFDEDIYFQYIDVYNRIIKNKLNMVNPGVLLKGLGL